MSLEDIKKKYKHIIAIEPPELYYPFATLSLNVLVGSNKGLRGGRLYQIIGNESTGKSTVSLDLIAQTQKDNKLCAYFDIECTFDKHYAKTVGVDTDNLLLITPEQAEQCFTLVEELIKSGVHIIVIDSIPALVPASENDKHYEDREQVASIAGPLTRFCRRLIPLLHRTGSIVIFINQNRANFSPMSRKETKPFGGKAIQYFVSLTIDLARIERKEEYSTIQATIEKSKIGLEKARVLFTIVYGKGIDRNQDILNLALEHDIIKKKGAWLEYEGRQAQGMKNAARDFSIDSLRKKVLDALE